MLGRYVYGHLKNIGHNVVGYTRNEIDAAKITTTPELSAVMFHHGMKKDDVVINCIGAIKPQIDKLGILNAIQVNSVFPHLLANSCEAEGYELIHITTDCVFSGDYGKYDEESDHDCTDVYGKTKSLGEPKNCTVVRTSIIGEELETSRSLIEWVKAQDGKEINGYTDHFWNGITCFQAAKVFAQIIKDELYWYGVKHVYSPEPMSKYEMVSAIAAVHKLNIKINPVLGPFKSDRTLSTCAYDEVTFLPFCLMFNIPHIYTQLEEQYNTLPNLI